MARLNVVTITAHSDSHDDVYFRVLYATGSIRYITHDPFYSDGDMGEYEVNMDRLNRGEIPDYSAGQFDFEEFESQAVAQCTLFLSEDKKKEWANAASQSWTEFVEAEVDKNKVIVALWTFAAQSEGISFGTV